MSSKILLCFRWMSTKDVTRDIFRLSTTSQHNHAYIHLLLKHKVWHVLNVNNILTIIVLSYVFQLEKTPNQRRHKNTLDHNASILVLRPTLKEYEE